MMLMNTKKLLGNSVEILRRFYAKPQYYLNNVIQDNSTNLEVPNFMLINKYKYSKSFYSENYKHVSKRLFNCWPYLHRELEQDTLNSEPLEQLYNK